MDMLRCDHSKENTRSEKEETKGENTNGIQYQGLFLEFVETHQALNREILSKRSQDDLYEYELKRS